MDPDRLSEHFIVAEFTMTRHIDLLERQRIGWRAPGIREAAAHFCLTVLEDVRAETCPLILTSGYRCPDLNRAVGGRPTSRHMLGLAADVHPVHMSLDEAMRRIAQALRAGRLPYLDEAILEYGSWIHLQGCPAVQRPRGLLLQCVATGGYEPYHDVP